MGSEKIECREHGDEELTDCFQCNGTYCSECFDICPCEHPSYWSEQQLLTMNDKVPQVRGAMTISLNSLKLKLSNHAKTWRLVCETCGKTPTEDHHGPFVQGDECPECVPDADHGGTLCWEGDRVPYDGYDFGIPSKAVVACNSGEGAVLWYAGGHLSFEIHEAVGNHLGDLGLDNAPLGISVWEGKVNYHEYQTMEGTEADSEVVGDFRPPTDEEWEAIKAGRNPWDERDFYLKWPVKP